MIYSKELRLNLTEAVWMESTLPEEKPTMTTVDRSAKNAKMSLPTELIEVIFSRLPVKSILRFRSLSKPWLNRISEPSFAKIHRTRAHHTALFMTALDRSTYKYHLLTAPLDGGPLTHIMTLDEFRSIIQVEHLNGLVCLTCSKWSTDRGRQYRTVIVNPSTHKVFEIPDIPNTDHRMKAIHLLFGFDESSNEFKILMIRRHFRRVDEIMIFSMSSYSWRKINADPPIGYSWNDMYLENYNSVCVNSVIHVVLEDSFDILAFDLRTEKFSIINNPHGVSNDEDDVVNIVKINGCIGLVYEDRVIKENYKLPIWILQDYENRVWVKEFITSPEPLFKSGLVSPIDSINMDEIIFPPSNCLCGSVTSAVVYNRKSGCFKSLRFTPGYHFPLSTTLVFNKIRCYVESMLPL